MAILQKKINVKPGLPDHIKNSLDLWMPLQNVICAAFSELVETSWEAGLAEVKAGSLKELKSALPKTGLYFGYGTEEGSPIFLTHYDVNFAEQITRRSLAVQSQASDKAYEPGMLDLILFKPITDVVNDELREIFTAIYRNEEAPLNDIVSGISPAGIDLPKDITLWNEVTLHIRPVQDDMPEPQPDKKEVKGKKTTKSQKAKNGKIEETKEGFLSVKILIPQKLLCQISESSLNGVQAPVIDPENPWTRHMRNSLDSAIVPVRAVVETCRMTVADCTRFEIGQVIDLPGVSLQSIGLETAMSEGPVNFGLATLGIYKSHRAVKLVSDMDPEFCSDSIII